MGSIANPVSTGASRAAAFALAGAWLLPLAACSKTSDGTVIMPKPPAISSLVPSSAFVPSWMRSKKPEPQPEIVAAAAFPPPPASSAPKAKRRIQPVIVRRNSSGKLACNNETGPNGRVRVVCK